MGAARKLDQDQAAFEDKQLSSLESIAEREPAKLLDEAVKIKLIDQETRDKINTAIPGHEVLFTKTLEKAGTGPGAFKKAFRLVYGRFLMERESGTEKENAALISKLNSVLKFEVDEHIIKGRPELQAAARRLRTYAASRKKPADSAKFNLPITEKRKEFLLRRKKTTERYQEDIQAVSDYVDSIGTSAEGSIDLNFLVQDVTQVESDIANLETDLNSIESGIRVDKLSTDEVVKFFALDPKFVFSLSEDQLNELSAEMKINTAFARKLLGIDFDATLDTNDVEKAYEKFMVSFDPNKLADRSKDDIMAKIALHAKETLDDLISYGIVQPIIDPFAERESVRGQIKSKKKGKATLDTKLKSGREQNSGSLEMLDGFEYGIELLREDVNISFAAKKLCDDYINSYQSFKAGAVLDDKEKIKKFLRNEVKDFVRRLKETLDENLGTYNKDIGIAQTEIDGFSAQLDNPDGITGILEKAFPSAKSGAVIKRLEREHHEAEHKEHELGDVYKYFSSHDSFTNVVEGGSQLSAAIRDWKDEQTKSVGAIEVELSALDSDKTDERAKLEKKKNKAGLPLNARIAYLDEQISLKNKSIRSSDSIEKALNEMGKIRDPAKPFVRETERETMEKENERKAEELGVLKDEHKRLTLIAAKTKEFRDELTKLVIKAVKAEHLGIDIEKYIGVAHEGKADDHGKKGDHHGVAAEISSLLQKINLDNGNFDPQVLIDLYGKFNGLFGDSERVQKLLEDFDAASAEKAKATKDSKKALDKANAEVEKGKNLTDDQAAKKIIGAMVGEQFPDLSPTDHNKLVSMILADDVATLQTDEGYEALAQRGSAEKLETLKFAGFRAKLLNFKFKEGEKITQPFKGLKPDDFKDWASMEKLFLSGKLNYKNAFFVLAAFEEFDNGVKSIQAVQLEKKLKKLLAKQMGVDEHMDKAGLSKIVDDAFKAQMEKVRPIMKAHSETVDSKGGKAKEHKQKVLDMKYEELNDQLRTDKISHKVYEHKLEALVKEASESDVKVEFSADSVGAQLWNSPEAQWLRDKGHDTGAFLGKKALAVGAIAPLKIVGSGLWGGAKLGASLGFQAAMMPFRAAKYPLLLAAKPMVGAINLFRSNKWTPLPGIIDSIKNDAGRVVGYTTEKATGVVKGTAETVTKTTAGEWGKVKFTDTKYLDRNKHHADERAEMLKIHEPKSDIDPIEVAESPFISFDKYNKQIEMVTKALGITIHAPGAHEVKVGHEEKVADKKEEAKKDDHAKPEAAHDAHEKKPEAAHGHH